MPKLWGDIEDRIERKLKASLEMGGQVIATQAKRNVQKSPRGGRTYKKYNPNREHTASAPGESPATDTGSLVRSITVVVDGKRMSVIVKCAKNIAPYAKVLEYGSSDGIIKSRPFMRPALREKREQVIRLLRRAMREGIRGA